MFGYIYKIKDGGDDGEDDSACAECGCSAICAPGSTAVKYAAPNDECGCEEKGEGGVAYIFGVFCKGPSVLTPNEGEDLHDGGYDGKGPW